YIIRLFSKHLGRKRVEKLESFEEDDSKEHEEESEGIKAIVEETGLVAVEYCFPDALDKIINNYKEYALFIADRNLSESEYYPDEVSKVDPDYTQIQYDDYFEREGDYLFYKLALIKRADIIKKFYYLTDHLAEEKKISGHHDIAMLVDMKKFSKDNFVRKGDDRAFKRLHQLIDNIEISDIRNENRAYFKILRDNIDEKASRRLLHVLYNKDSDKKETIVNNLELLKSILEKILTEAAKRLNAPASCWDKNGRLIIRNFLTRLAQSETSGKTVYKFGTNSLLKIFFYAVYGIAAEFGSHDKSRRPPSGYQATANTVNALIYALKDIILWFGEICQKH
ncbi:hypothetical protein QUF72_14085, partial [Desulfobacterales bacterium HSG2]|nr:hypothetical protein [Desulfobacterales bacterium HSG2]